MATRRSPFLTCVKQHEFLLLIVAAISLAKVDPAFGERYLYPDITATWLAVILIFILAGLGLPTLDLLQSAFSNTFYNCLIQTYNFVFISALAFGVTHLLLRWHWLQNPALADGMLICACLPMAINAVLVISQACQGDEASSLFNVAFGNLMGVFISPFLILFYLGVQGTMHPLHMFGEISLRVLLPVAIGQVLQRFLLHQHKYDICQWNSAFKRVQQYSLVFIVYTVFCRTFAESNALAGNPDAASSLLISSSDIMVITICEALITLVGMVIFWYILQWSFPNQPKLLAFGIIGGTFKTIAVGVPLIHAMYATSDPEHMGIYTIPLLIWHPTQLIIGSLMAPYVSSYVTSELLRIEGTSQPSVDSNDSIIPNEKTALLV
jgi:solute carrier family 10 (sodium/bile acid cotransporter), member 7